jgi:hypothetical protein
MGPYYIWNVRHRICHAGGLGRAADYKSAIQQTASLRYEAVTETNTVHIIYGTLGAKFAVPIVGGQRG